VPHSAPNTVFDALIASKTRVRILMRLFLDPARRIHLRQMARDCAVGKDSGLVDLLLIGDINQTNLADLITKTERHIKRKIRVLVLSANEFERLGPTLSQRPQLLLWHRPITDTALDISHTKAA